MDKKKRHCHLEDFAVPADQNENERKGNDKEIPGSCPRAEKTGKIKVAVIPFLFGTLGTILIGQGKRLGRL